ncbi:hypothetical protein WR25_05073 [Diploscapter pachys]|uniref:Uncharacterized protein n=1 Tax=Diploscapter pachys TaxID=2018661 RepID=A0A2A2M304_9BILA|nr:hypothetical protein WR25_05073 [Diploscapter pachys]
MARLCVERGAEAAWARHRGDARVEIREADRRLARGNLCALAVEERGGAAGVERFGGGLCARSEIGCAVGDDKRRRRVEQHGVAIRARLSIEQAAQCGGVIGRVTAADGGERVAGQAGVFRRDARWQRRAADIHREAGAGGGELVQALFARNHRGACGAELFQRLGIEAGVIGAGDADQLVRHARRIGERPHQVEDRTLADAAADRRDPRHRRVMVGGEEEGDADIGEASLRGRAGDLHVEAERLQRIRSAGLGRGGTVAVLGDRYAAGRDDQRDGGRDVERMMPVTARAADVDRAIGSGDRDQAGTQGTGGLGDFDAGFAAIGQSEQEVADRLCRDARVEDIGKRLRRAFARQRGRWIGKQDDAGHGRSRTGMPAIVRKLASMAWPCSVAMLSGWNCTPWIGRCSWRKPMTMPSWVRALTTRGEATSLTIRL